MSGPIPPRGPDDGTPLEDAGIDCAMAAAGEAMGVPGGGVDTRAAEAGRVFELVFRGEFEQARARLVVLPEDVLAHVAAAGANLVDLACRIDRRRADAAARLE